MEGNEIKYERTKKTNCERTKRTKYEKTKDPKCEKRETMIIATRNTSYETQKKKTSYETQKKKTYSESPRKTNSEEENNYGNIEHKLAPGRSSNFSTRGRTIGGIIGSLSFIISGVDSVRRGQTISRANSKSDGHILRDKSDRLIAGAGHRSDRRRLIAETPAEQAKASAEQEMLRSERIYQGIISQGQLVNTNRNLNVIKKSSNLPILSEKECFHDWRSNILKGGFSMITENESVRMLLGPGSQKQGESSAKHRTGVPIVPAIRASAATSSVPIRTRSTRPQNPFYSTNRINADHLPPELQIGQPLRTVLQSTIDENIGATIMSESVVYQHLCRQSLAMSGKQGDFPFLVSKIMAYCFNSSDDISDIDSEICHKESHTVRNNVHTMRNNRIRIFNRGSKSANCNFGGPNNSELNSKSATLGSGVNIFGGPVPFVPSERDLSNFLSNLRNIPACEICESWADVFHLSMFYILFERHLLPNLHHPFGKENILGLLLTMIVVLTSCSGTGNNDSSGTSCGQFECAETSSSSCVGEKEAGCGIGEKAATSKLKDEKKATSKEKTSKANNSQKLSEKVKSQKVGVQSQKVGVHVSQKVGAHQKVGVHVSKTNTGIRLSLLSRNNMGSELHLGCVSWVDFTFPVTYQMVNYYPGLPPGGLFSGGLPPGGSNLPADNLNFVAGPGGPGGGPDNNNFESLGSFLVHNELYNRLSYRSFMIVKYHLQCHGSLRTKTSRSKTLLKKALRNPLTFEFPDCRGFSI